MEIINSVVTLIVGSIALFAYWLSKKHEKRNAAIVIIMDIRHAEFVVISILEKGLVDINTKDVLKENNWSKYKHLFASKLSQDDFVAFNGFFDSCVEMSDARKRIRKTFYNTLNIKAEIMQQKVLSVEGINTPDGKEKRLQIIQQINNEDCVFEPKEPKDRILLNLKLMGKLSNTVAFEKLKKVARI